MFEILLHLGKSPPSRAKFKLLALDRRELLLVYPGRVDTIQKIELVVSLEWTRRMCELNSLLEDVSIFSRGKRRDDGNAKERDCVHFSYFPSRRFVCVISTEKHARAATITNIPNIHLIEESIEY